MRTIKYPTILVSLLLFMVFSCTTRPPMPPERSPALATYNVQYIPKDYEKHLPSKEDPYPPFKMTYAHPGQSPKIIEDEKPTKPYIIIGEMEFSLNWYDNKSIADLIRLHVPKTGGDGVLTYHMTQSASAMMKNPDTGKLRNLYYGTISLEIIKYTEN